MSLGVGHKVSPLSSLSRRCLERGKCHSFAIVKRVTARAGHRIKSVEPLTFIQARELVVEGVRAARMLPAIERVSLDLAAGRVLAADIAADRDVPALDRSVRDGFAVRAADV